MNHAEAVQTKTSEKYLLGELTASQEDEFAEHFFDCEECSNDLRMTSLFLQTTKKVLAEDRVPKVNATARPWASAWRYAVAACVALFAVTLYQNTVTIPALRQAAAPQALQFFSLASLGARSAGQATIAPTAGRPFVLLIDIPPQPDAAAFRAQVLNTEGKQLLAIDIAAEMATKTVPLLIPAKVLTQGKYLLALSARSGDAAAFHEFERQPLQVM